MPGILNSLGDSYNSTILNNHLKFGICTYLDSLRKVTGSGLWSGNCKELLDWRNQRLRLQSLTVINSHASIQVLAESIISETINLYLSNELTESSTSSLKLISKMLLSEMDSNDLKSSVWRNIIEIDGSRRSGTVSIYTNSVNQSKIIDVWLDGCIREESTHYQFTIAPTDYLVACEETKNPVAYAPMPGKIIQIIAKQGCEVKQGDPLVILEAMKMEHLVSAPNTGIVNIFCEIGCIVSEGSKLAEVISMDL